MKTWISQFAGIALATSTSVVYGQARPTKPIKYIVPFAPGGTTGILGRTIADKLTVMLGQPVIIENTPGARVN